MSVVAGEMRLQEEAPIDPRELEEAVYKQWIDGSETGRYESIADMAKATGITRQTLKPLISAKEDRLAEISDPVINEAAYYDLNKTKKLQKSHPEARAELLKQKKANLITQPELRELTEIIAETPDHDSKSAKLIIDEFKAIKEEQKAETKDALKRRKLKAEGVEGISITKGTTIATLMMKKEKTAWRCVLIPKAAPQTRQLNLSYFQKKRTMSTTITSGTSTQR